jgi:hypothetical protein
VATTKRRGRPVNEPPAPPELRPDPANVRVHPERNRALIRRSLEEVGPGRSILVAGDGIIRAGNGVHEQAAALGIAVRVVDAAPDELIAVRRADLKGARAERAALLDNRAGELSGWDVLALQDLADRTPELLDGLFDLAELDALLTAPAESRAPVDPANDPAAEWQGMPGFEHEDRTAFRTLTIHFPDMGAVQDFARRIGQPISDATRFLWHPRQEVIRYGDAE